MFRRTFNKGLLAIIIVCFHVPKIAFGFDYITTKDIISPFFGDHVPKKNESIIEPTTGVSITRITDVNDLQGTSSAFIVYSRYSPENSSGHLLLVFGDNSVSSWVSNTLDGTVVTELKNENGRQIGENHEVRWDNSGKHPNRIYFRDGMKFYLIDDVVRQSTTVRLVKDFSSLVPEATLLYNDVEGDSSNDSDHWAWMAVHYDGVTNQVDAFIHYQISTDTIHMLRPDDLAGSPLDHYKNKGFSRPNMVEVSPKGTGVVLHFGRAWGDESYGSRSKDIGTWFDGPHLWPLDFKYGVSEPVKISVDQTHSGWSFDNNGIELFISQNNRTDWLDVIAVSGLKKGYENRIQVASHADFGWSNGFHYGKMPESKPGWAFVNTYSNVKKSSHNTDWAADQLFLIQTKPQSDNPIIWRIGPNYNRYDGNYRDEAPAAINMNGNRIYVSNNWGGMLDHQEIFVFKLPETWREELTGEPIIKRADVDHSGEINSTDALLTLRKLLKLNMAETNWKESPTTGDVNCDGIADSDDIPHILRYSLQLKMSGEWCD